MKPKEIPPVEIYRIIDRKTGEAVCSYPDEEYDFDSVYEAGSQDIYSDYEQHKIAKYKVTYELLDEDCEDDWMDFPEEPEYE